MHWDMSMRMDAVASLVRFIEVDGAIATAFMAPLMLQYAKSHDVSVKHGALLALSAIMRFESLSGDIKCQITDVPLMVHGE